MLALTIEKIGPFMKKLLLQDTFDFLLLSEASITTFATFSIDGQFHSDFFAGEEDSSSAGQEEALASWSRLRPHCFFVIKGKQLPLSFQFIFQLPPAMLRRILESEGAPISADDIFGVYLNIQFRGGQLTVTTGSSLRVFTTDRSLDRIWDAHVRSFLQKEGLWEE